MKLSEIWDLESIFSGGSCSSSFQATYKETEKKIETLNTFLSKKKYSDAIPLMQDIGKILREMDSFAGCLLSQNVNDVEATKRVAEMNLLQTSFSNCHAIFEAELRELPAAKFEELLKTFPSIAFILKEKRQLALNKLSANEELFINQLSLDGYHGWYQLWEASIGEMTFTFHGDNLYFGQIENKLSDPNREVRKKAFEAITKEFKKRQASIAQALNHLAGFRLQVYHKRGWKDVLKEPLEINRLSNASLMAMWNAVKDHQDCLLSFFECKSTLLGLGKLFWWDLEAPLSPLTEEISFQAAADAIVEHFQTFSPKMAAFAKHAFKNRWIEAEDRKGKASGGYCSFLPCSNQSRIFMTFSKTITNLYTLAHELGHAFHNEVFTPLEEMVQHPSMGLAETASTMAEMIVTRQAIQKEHDPKKRLLLLDDHLTRSCSYLMNIYARFLFETKLYAKRSEEFVSHEDLSLMMEEAQKEAYRNALENYHPLFWATKVHFYLTPIPFYNFPYTFGYLFSLGVFTYMNQLPDKEAAYIALLQDTGRMNSEDLAKKHLNVDLTTPIFWQQGLEIIKHDIKEFTQLAKEFS
ncbi:MAG: M3 family oligoendopeptidase [Chlamydiia bacterium]|nr:M3 family oligoendopeptidase [Chlamydiia bacterium]